MVENIKLFNSLGKEVQDFKPLEKGKVKLYACGPTVYNYAHIGNFRSFVAVDLLVRYLRYKGLEVNHVMNITDIDDKIIGIINKEGKSLKDFTEYYTKAFLDDLSTLRVKLPDTMTKATDYVDKMVELVEKLVENGHAYVKDGSVYFDVLSFENYGSLIDLDLASLKDNAGGRLDVDEYDKDNVKDFALWKAREESDGEIYWPSPWGDGRPGWHIECSAMSTDKLGPTFDIHSGGVDLKFPHHCNEIAQSEGGTKKKFVNYWFHVEHLIVEGKKMSKSLGNFYTLRDLLDKGYYGEQIRYLLMSTHYRQQLNFTLDGLKAAQNSLERLKEFVLKLKDSSGSDVLEEEIVEVKDKFESAMDNDLNISEALGHLFDFVREVNKKNLDEKSAKETLEVVFWFDQILGLALEKMERGELPPEIITLIDEREDARKNKDWVRADEIRDELKKAGVVIEDSPDGVKWKLI